MAILFGLEYYLLEKAKKNRGIRGYNLFENVLSYVR